MLIDLQLHSIYSDGYLTPTQLVSFLSKNKIKLAALTDHNTIEGLGEFRRACKLKKIRSINGLELYCKHKNKRINILWYNFDEKKEELLCLLEESKKRRLSIVKKSLLRLEQRGFRVDLNYLLDDFNNYIPINRLLDKVMSNKINNSIVLKALKEKMPYAKKFREEEIMSFVFFNKKKDYLRESYIDIERVVGARKIVGGQLVFCHPGKHNKYANNITQELKNIGIDGIEVLSPHHSIGAVMHAQFLAENLDMIATGGSDFHRFEEVGLINSSADWFEIDSKKLRRINEIIL